MKKALFATLALSLLLTPQLLASGSSGTPGPTAAPAARDPLTVTATMKCTITTIKEAGTIMVRDGQGEPEHAMDVDHRTRVMAQDKNAFDGRKKLKIADLAVGQELKVTHRPATGEVLRIKVLKKS